MDDGTSFDYLLGKHTLDALIFTDFTLSVLKLKGESFDGAMITNISEVSFYFEQPITHCPVSVREHYTGATRLTVKCDGYSVTVSGLKTPVEFSMQPDMKYDLITLIF
jgi:hypothetical protein